MKALHVIALVLLIVGGLNWGFIGLFDYNFVEHISSAIGGGSTLVRIIYDLVGLSAIYKIFCCKSCSESSCQK